MSVTFGASGEKLKPSASSFDSTNSSIEVRTRLWFFTSGTGRATGLRNAQYSRSSFVIGGASAAENVSRSLPACSERTLKRAVSIQFRRVRICVSSSGSAAPGGGMARLETCRIRMLLSDQPCRITGPLVLPLSRDSSVSRFNPAIGSPLPWQATQRDSKIGEISLSKRASSSEEATATRAVSSESTPPSIHRRIVSIFRVAEVLLEGRRRHFPLRHALVKQAVFQVPFDDHGSVVAAFER